MNISVLFWLLEWTHLICLVDSVLIYLKPQLFGAIRGAEGLYLVIVYFIDIETCLLFIQAYRNYLGSVSI